MPPPGGYAWWYVDGMSDDGAHALTLIGFIGSVFSPYYAHSRRVGRPDPLNHCALNVALYSKHARRWAMTERGARRVHAQTDSLAVGASEMHWTGDSLDVTVDEHCAPIPRRIRGVVKLHPLSLCHDGFDLDAAGQHRWHPYAPCARIEVRLTEPRLHWQGAGYFDANAGASCLERAFRRWHWSRSIDSHRCVLLYDVETAARESRSLALRADASGAIEHIDAPSPVLLPRSRWRVPRVTRADAGTTPVVMERLEDAPFYARSLLNSTVLGTNGPAMHESLDLERFSRLWVQCLLPFRMPRIR